MMSGSKYGADHSLLIMSRVGLGELFVEEKKCKKQNEITVTTQREKIEDLR